MENIRNFQELSRQLDATIKHINPDGLATGQNAMLIINFMASIPNAEKYTGSEFMNFMKTEIENAKNKSNVREQVKKIWMYPKSINQYEPWINFALSEDVLRGIHEQLSAFQFKFEMVDSKVYLVSLNGSISELIFGIIGRHLPPNIIPNVESTHVTAVNSNIVNDIGIEHVSNFLKNYQETITLNFGNIKSTISNDWSVFSECYVIEVHSVYLNSFVNTFNTEFNKAIKPSPHITFAINPRSLF